MRGLRPHLLGSRIEGAHLLWQRSLAAPHPEQLPALLNGEQVGQVSRRGKFVVLTLLRGTLLIHLRMSGDLRVEPQSADLLTHDRALFALDGGRRLVFNDARKFGRIWLVEDAAAVLGNLGPEPFDPRLDSEVWRAMLTSRRRQLKPLLMDQSFIAGLGNIYTDEALHLAGLHPSQPSDTLDSSTCARLLQAVRHVLEEGIRRNGASIDWVYRGGDFQNHFRVYQRTGQPCPVCGAVIQRIVVGQRSTHFCPACQVLQARS